MAMKFTRNGKNRYNYYALHII